jgi:PIN like domain
MSTSPGPVYFTDENTLGLGKHLRRSGRDDVLYPGHEDLPEVPLGTLDLDWMPIVAEWDLIVVTRDRRIRTRPRPSSASTASTGSGRSGSEPSKTWDRVRRWSSSSSTSLACSERSPSADRGRGRWR